MKSSPVAALLSLLIPINAACLLAISTYVSMLLLLSRPIYQWSYDKNRARLESGAVFEDLLRVCMVSRPAQKILALLFVSMLGVALSTGLLSGYFTRPVQSVPASSAFFKEDPPLITISGWSFPHYPLAYNVRQRRCLFIIIGR